MENKIQDYMKKLPMLVTRGYVPLPNNTMKIDVGREVSMNALKLALDEYDGYIYIVSQKNPLIEDLQVEDLFTVGAIAKIRVSSPIQAGGFRVTLEVLDRARQELILETHPSFIAEVKQEVSYSSDDKEEYTLLRMAIDVVEKFIKSNARGMQKLTEALNRGYTAAAFTDVVAENLPLTIERKQEYLETLSINERLLMLVKDLHSEIEIAQLETKIEQDVKESFDATQREYYLREKLRVIREELGDKNSKETDVDILKKQIEASLAPQAVKDKLLEELGRFEIVPPASSESGVIRNYIDWVLAIPWGAYQGDSYSLALAQKILDEDHYGMKEIKKRILEFLAVHKLTDKTKGAIICLVGPPGVGKTSLAKSIARAMDRQYVKIALGGVRDEAEIRGHRKTYIGAMPGKIIQSLKKAKSMNPVFLMDEVDKMASDFRGDPVSALLEVLDPEQNNQFVDHYIEEEVDLSNVLFIMTANYYEGIPAPLYDRMEIIELGSYTEDEKLNIAQKYLIPKQMKLNGIAKEMLKLNKAVIQEMIKNYAREAGVRGLERQIAKLCRKAAVRIAEGIEEPTVITKDNLEEYLGKKIFRHTQIEKNNQVGVVSGLAYTSFGGDVLPVEVTYYPGKESLVLTGKLGDVMKESAMIALSLVKSKANTLGIAATFFDQNTIHIHFPEGAVPKDGPSAGVTIATAIISALTNKKVQRTVGMTGEINLRGSVLAIGGLKEKAMAAQRSGLKTILIPKDNERDISDIPEAVRKKLEIIPIATLNEALDIAIV